MHRRWTLCGAALAVLRAGALSAGVTARTDEAFLRQARDARDRASARAAAVRFGDPVRFDKPAYSCSDLARVEVYAPDWVTDPNAIDSIGGDSRNPIRIATRSGELRPYVLVETAAGSGIFTGAARLVCGGQLGSGRGPYDGILSAAADDMISLVFQDSPGDLFSASAPIRDGGSSGDASAAFDKAAYALGETATVTIVDPDGSVDPRTVNPVAFAAYSDSDLAGVLAEAMETAPGAGVFVAQLFLTNTQHSAGGRLYAAPGDTIYATFADRIPDGGNGERRVTATASIRR